MKVAIAARGKNLESMVDERFGRCLYFLIIDTDSGEFEVVENRAVRAFRGAGVMAAQMLVDKGVKEVVAGNFGPNAVRVLSESKVEIFTVGKEEKGRDSEIKVKEVLKKHKAGELEKVKRETVSFGRGMGGRRERRGGLR